jgi:hypothetical protein
MTVVVVGEVVILSATLETARPYTFMTTSESSAGVWEEDSVGGGGPCEGDDTLSRSLMFDTTPTPASVPRAFPSATSPSFSGVRDVEDSSAVEGLVFAVGRDNGGK